jgi:hypothetical protein
VNVLKLLRLATIVGLLAPALFTLTPAKQFLDQVIGAIKAKAKAKAKTD